MGEVYRARDPRLGRDVAIKVLPASFSQDADRLRRFEQEARAAGVLNHPNITAVYDIGTHEGAPYVVQELLEGETLRAALAGGKMRAAQGDRLRAADRARPGGGAREGDRPPGPEAREPLRHEGRPGQDPRLRPGEADASNEARPDATSLPTAAGATEPGVVLGTLGYMSPEQVKGKPADARSRHLLLRRDPLRDARRARRASTATRRRRRCRRSCGRSRRTSPSRTRRLARPRADRPPLPREEPRAALPLGARRRVRARSPSGLSAPATPAAAAVEAGRSRRLGLVAAAVLVAADRRRGLRGRLDGRRPAPGPTSPSRS